MRRNALIIPLLPAAALAAVGAFAANAAAHSASVSSPGPRDWHELSQTWGWEPGSLVGLAISAAWYGVGLWRTWRDAGVGHGIRRWEMACYAGGWLTLFIALVSPLHPWGQVLFAAHMTQHELLMLVAAPLLVLGRPMIACLRALPPPWAGTLARLGNRRGWQSIWGGITTPFVAWILHAAVLWAWHAPRLFEATLHDEWIHAAQHLSFLASALLFWWALLHGRRGAAAYGVGVLYLFTTALHSGLLGALLTFSRSVWYPAYVGRTEPWGLTPLEDQQLGGLVMWVPACLVYIVGGLAMFAGWMRESERRVARREALRSSAGAPRAGGVAVVTPELNSAGAPQ